MDSNFTEKKVSLQLTESEAAFVYDLLSEGGNMTTYTWHDQDYFEIVAKTFIGEREGIDPYEDWSDEQCDEAAELTKVLTEGVANLHKQLSSYQADFL